MNIEPFNQFSKIEINGPYYVCYSQRDIWMSKGTIECIFCRYERKAHSRIYKLKGPKIKYLVYNRLGGPYPVYFCEKLINYKGK